MAKINTKDIDVLILCGGLGSRLGSITQNCPKPMLKISNKPFLDIVIGYIANFGFRRFILCTGYKSNIVADYYKKKKNNYLKILISKEKKPLGTAGAIKNAQKNIKSNHFLVINGDGICLVNLRDVLNFHINKKALVSIITIYNNDPTHYGTITLGKSQRIVKFKEKSKIKNKNNLISTGIYFFNKKLMSLIPKNKNVSLEYDIFPKIIDKKIYGYITQEPFVDIGTPQRYNRAKHFFKKIKF
ncbi:MAG: sugar phosphate nucleotidyltransferase [Candidatus Omnitrophota bacterium]